MRLLSKSFFSFSTIYLCFSTFSPFVFKTSSEQLLKTSKPSEKFMLDLPKVTSRRSLWGATTLHLGIESLYSKNCYLLSTSNATQVRLCLDKFLVPAAKQIQGFFSFFLSLLYFTQVYILFLFSLRTLHPINFFLIVVWLLFVFETLHGSKSPSTKEQ